MNQSMLYIGFIEPTEYDMRSCKSKAIPDDGEPKRLIKMKPGESGYFMSSKYNLCVSQSFPVQLVETYDNYYLIDKK